MITVYDAYGRPHQVTLAEYIQLEAAELVRLLEMAKTDPAK